MRRIFSLMGLGFILVCLTGCLSIEQRIEKIDIENEAKKAMISYLKDNYDIKKVSNVEAQYGSSLGGSFPSYFKNEVVGTFKKNGKSHVIYYDYESKKCYDSYSYTVKISPIIINHIDSLLNKNSTKKVIKPNYVEIFDGLGFRSSYLRIEGEHGLFNNNDEVRTYEDVINYYEARGLYAVYEASDTVIKDNIDSFKNLYEDSEIPIEVNVYNNKFKREILNVSNKYDKKDYTYTLNEIRTLGDFIVYWTAKKEVSIYDYTGMEKINDFDVNIVKNTYFEDTIKLYGSKYYLYSQNILQARNTSNDNNNFVYLSIETKGNVCGKDKTPEIMYIDDGLKAVGYSKKVFYSGAYEKERFAIYCKNK